MADGGAAGRGWERAVDGLALLGVWAYLLRDFRPELLLLDTLPAGGDTTSFLQPILHLKEVLLPAGNPMGWDLANFGGYAPYQYYFLPPALLIVALSMLMPLAVAFKLVSVAGTFLLPLAVALALRALGYRSPAPALGAAASLLFLYNEGNTMWGGNIPSTLAGEFAFSLGLALAVLFVGQLHRGIRRQSGWRSLGALLALTGLCHPVAFLNATASGAFFLLGRRNFVRNLRFLGLVYGAAVLLMAFWLVPLVAKLGWATSINWTWHFASWRELLPRVLWPPAVLAALDVGWIVLHRRNDDERARYLMFAGVASLLLFSNAAQAGLPEIRFVPFVYLTMLLLAVDFLVRLAKVVAAKVPEALSGRPLVAVATALVALACGLWTGAHRSFIPSWIQWNYSGLESKPDFPLLQSLAGELAGSIGDPRIVYENSPGHNRFGTMRVFENLELWSGRATLEGVMLQAGLTAPFVYWIQSLVSLQGTGAIPGYPYPTMNPERATPRLELFNAHDWITVTPEVQARLRDLPRWRSVFAKQGYEVFHLDGADPRYVQVPRFRPALLSSDDWKRDFHRWFSTDAALDVPLVLDRGLSDEDRRRIGSRAESPVDPPRIPIDARCEIEERIDHQEIEFTTSCPGVPHWLSLTWFPNWEVAEGAARTYLSSPAFLLVVPDAERVVLRFRRTGVDWLGLVLTVGGFAVCLAPGLPRRVLGEPSGGLARLATRAHPFLVRTAVGALVVVSCFGALRGPVGAQLQRLGWSAFSAGDYDRAFARYRLAERLSEDPVIAAEAAFFQAASRFRQEDHEHARELYDRVVARYPESSWLAESHYHAALCLDRRGKVDAATERLRLVVERFPGDRWAAYAAERLAERGAGEPTARD